MKVYLTGVILMFTVSVFAQIPGNKNLETRTFQTSEIRSIKVNLYADVVINASGEVNEIKISVDENLLEEINLEVIDGVLDLNQKEWIQPSNKIYIGITAPNLERIEQSTHETTLVQNLYNETFRAMGLVGKIKLEGSVKTLSLGGEIGEIDASKLESEEVHVNLWDIGVFKVGSTKTIDGKISEGTLYYTDSKTNIKVSTQNGGQVYSLSEEKIPGAEKKNIQFITFQLKNNSNKRIDCYVKGPNSEGGKFSYGFPLNPGQVRKKDWSVGSKVYQVSKVGTRKLLKEISLEDDGTTVLLFEE